MYDSEQIINRFSRRTYLKDRVGSAYIAPVREPNRILKSIMEYLIETDSDASLEEWARYFLKSFLGASKIYRLVAVYSLDIFLADIYLIYLKICQELIFNYLQPVCWQAALKTNQMFKSSPNIEFQYPVEECFAIACIAIYQPIKIFKGFDFQPHSSVEAYALNSLKRIIKNQIAKELKTKTIKLSDNGLLRNLEKKELEKILKVNQYSQIEIDLYCQALQAFKEIFNEIYSASTANSEAIRTKKPQTTPLTDQQLSQIAKRYNQQIKRLGIQGKLANAQDIKQMLAACVQFVRNKTSIQSISMEEQGTGDLVDFTANPLDTALKNETQNELLQVREVILKELEALDIVAKKSLILWLGLGINQEDFLGMLNLSKQYQVARKFQGYQKHILKSLSQFVFSNYLNKDLTEKEIVQIINNNLNYLKEYLRAYSRNLFGEMLSEIIDREISKSERNTLKVTYENLKTVLKEQSAENISEIEKAGDRDLQEKIKSLLKTRIEQKLQISLLAFKSADESLDRFIDTYLQENTAALY